MEDNNLEFPFDFQLKKSSVSIIGIGGGAGRIVNKIQDCELPDTELSVFGMNRKEMEELSLPHKYLIGADGLGSGKDRSLAESECQKILPSLEKFITDKILSCFIVCLGGGTGEGCIKTFLQKAVDMQIKVKLLVVTLPHPSEGLEKRENALRLLDEIEKLVDGIFVVDYDVLPCSTISDLYNEADRKVMSIVSSFINMIVNPSLICFDFNDVRSFLRYYSDTKFIDFFTLSDNIDSLKLELKDLLNYLPKKYCSVYDISNIIIAINYNIETDDDIVRNFLDVVHSEIMTKLAKDSQLKWTMVNDSNMEKNIFRIDIFTKCN
jgi:cell division GTPase FtsZ